MNAVMPAIALAGTIKRSAAAKTNNFFIPYLLQFDGVLTMNFPSVFHRHVAKRPLKMARIRRKAQQIRPGAWRVY